jgi:hypothetical protein
MDQGAEKGRGKSAGDDALACFVQKTCDLQRCTVQHLYNHQRAQLTAWLDVRVCILGIGRQRICLNSASGFPHCPSSDEFSGQIWGWLRSYPNQSLRRRQHVFPLKVVPATSLLKTSFSSILGCLAPCNELEFAPVKLICLRTTFTSGTCVARGWWNQA